MPRPTLPCPGLYAITTEHSATDQQQLAAVEAALRGGARLIQYRSKSADERRRLAGQLLAACRSHGVPLIINDDVELAAQLGADGVHLGRDDIGLEEARARLGASALIGVSCYDSLERALAAQSRGADYVAFGRFFASRSKPDAPLAQLETLRLAKSRLRLPIVAIGGITPENGGSLLAAGADWLAVIDAVFGSDDPQAAAAAFQSLFEPEP